MPAPRRGSPWSRTCGRRWLDGGFDIHYQPLLDLGSNEVTGCEALLRWRHPERGMVSPAEFIPLAEDIGLINELGDWVLQTACSRGRHLAGPDPARRQRLAGAVEIARRWRCGSRARSRPPACRRTGWRLEITEAVLIHDDETALAILHQLRAIGVRIALDDFGTGFSSLSYLKRFPFDKIKIDRCFVSDIEVDGSADYRAGGGEHRRLAQHDHHGGRRRNRERKAIAAQTRLHPDAGLSVQHTEAGRRGAATARR